MPGIVHDEREKSQGEAEKRQDPQQAWRRRPAAHKSAAPSASQPTVSQRPCVLSGMAIVKEDDRGGKMQSREQGWARPQPYPTRATEASAGRRPQSPPPARLRPNRS
jgi:redox-sensitive bicupin YhaK (pirin superfamily)